MIDKIKNMGEGRKQKVKYYLDNAVKNGSTSSSLAGILKRHANTPAGKDDRDWKRVAVTELTDLKANSSLQQIIDEYGPNTKVWRRTKDSCDDCIKAFGSPSFPKQWVAGKIPDKYKGALHVNCKCGEWNLGTAPGMFKKSEDNMSILSKAIAGAQAVAKPKPHKSVKGIHEKIGNTKTGKPIMPNPDHEAHKNFTKQDHVDAYHAHSTHVHAGMTAEQMTHHKNAAKHHWDKFLATPIKKALADIIEKAKSEHHKKAHHHYKKHMALMDEYIASHKSGKPDEKKLEEAKEHATHAHHHAHKHLKSSKIEKSIIYPKAKPSAAAPKAKEKKKQEPSIMRHVPKMKKVENSEWKYVGSHKHEDEHLFQHKEKGTYRTQNSSGSSAMDHAHTLPDGYDRKKIKKGEGMSSDLIAKAKAASAGLKPEVSKKELGESHHGFMHGFHEHLKNHFDRVADYKKAKIHQSQSEFHKKSAKNNGNEAKASDVGAGWSHAEDLINKENKQKPKSKLKKSIEKAREILRG